MGLSCCLIGEDSLLIQCGNILLSKNHVIPIVVSSNRASIDWAKKNNILCIYSINDLLELNSVKFDYIFSIVNSRILPPEVIDLANSFVINYHDSLLPRYAGLNSTTWAIINHEKEHGVTWHIVNSKIDAGNIVKQNKVSILEEDTAFTLNLRCYEEAIKSFAELILDIESNKITFIKQDLQNRSYYGLGHNLPNLGFIDWKSFSADFIVRVNRALTFDHYDNNVGLLKIYLNNDYLIPIEMEVSSIECGSIEPGTVLAIEDLVVFISTIHHTLKIKRFISKKGENIYPGEVLSKHDIKVGYRFKNAKKALFKSIETSYSRILKLENYWVKQIKKLNEHSLFSPIQSVQSHRVFQRLSTPISLQRLENLNFKKIRKIALSAILIYLYRLNDYQNVSIFLVNKNHKKINKIFGNLFSTFMPFTTEWSSKISLAGILRHVGTNIQSVEINRTFFTDICARYPDTKNVSMESGVFINFSENFSQIKIPENAVIYFEYEKKTNEIQIYHRFDIQDAFCDVKNLIFNIPSHVSKIIDKILDNHHVSVNAFCFLTDTEKNILVNDWGKGVSKRIPSDSISELFEAQVRRRPNAPALFVNNNVISYHQLWSQAEKVTRFIKQNRIARHSLIGVYIERSEEMLSLVLGILKADCVYVPLDPRYPMLKIENITEIAELSWIFTSNKYLAKLEQNFSEKQSLEIRSFENITLSQYEPIKKNLKKTKKFKKLAYIMFTSGTTGDPKGVMTTQSNVINYCTWFCETASFTEKSIIDFSSSFAFDLSVPCTIAPLLVGGKIAICNEILKTDPKRYLKHLRDNQVSHVETTPGYLEMLLHYPNLVKKLTSLKMLLLGADILPVSDVIKWSKLCPAHQIVNEYGPTEATVSATSYFVSTDITRYNSTVPIGKPAFNTTCYVLDKYNNLCPLGIKGELYIGGAQIANGYLAKPMLTKEKFILSAFNNKQEVLYKTGDLVSWLSDGNLQFFGRNDFQVKIQGYRVELAGIESVLLKIPAVQQAVVIVKNGHLKDKYLCAYIVVDKSCPTNNEIKSFLLSHLPSYMVPKVFYTTHSIPLKQNEKIDYNALETQASEVLSFDYRVDSDLDIYENNIIKTWQIAFNDNQIRVDDDFFDLGGNSLIALQIVSELKNFYKIEIPLSFLFEFPTVFLLSEKIKKLLLTTNKKISNSRSIIKLSNHSNGIPLFLVHPIGGSIFWYKQLAKYMGKKYTLFGIQDISIDGDDLRFQSIEDMAKYYLKQIKKIYKGDYYHIGGASFGATVAFEMAHQIIKSGKKVSFLGIFDGWSKYPDDLMRTHSATLLQYKDTVLSAIEKQKSDYLESLEDYRRGLLVQYIIKPLNSSAVLFKASELWDTFVSIDDLNNGWSSFILGRLETHKVTGNHETIFFEPNVQKLSKIIDQLKIEN